MDFAQLKWRAEKLAGATSPGGSSFPADTGEAVNDAYRELAGVEQWEWLYDRLVLPTQAGVQAYTLPAPLRVVRSIATDGGGVLRPRASAPLDDRRPPPAAGRPVEYVLRGAVDLELWPEPDAVYELTIHGVREVEVLALASDVPLVPPDFHRTVAYLAAIGLLSHSPETDRADVRMQSYTALVANDLERMRGQYQAQHDTAPSVMGGRRMRRR